MLEPPPRRLRALLALTLRGCGVASKADQEIAGAVGVAEAVGALVGFFGVDQEDGVGGDGCSWAL